MMEPYYRKGDVALYCGDNADVLPALPRGGVDAVITSPPYAEQRKGLYGGVPEAEYPAWTVAWMEALRPCLASHASVLINIREHVRGGQISDYVHRTRLAVREAGWYEIEELIWHKTASPPVGHTGRPRRAWERVLWFAPTPRPFCDPRANGHPAVAPERTSGFAYETASRAWSQTRAHFHVETARCTDVVEVSVGALKGERVQHPAAFPVDLPQWLLRLVTPPGATVLDPFAGSCSTGIACILERRAFIGIERDPAYCAEGAGRLAGDPLPLFDPVPVPEQAALNL